MSMRITRIETVRFDPASVGRENSKARLAMPNNVWVQIHTDDGLAGLGETYYGPRAVSAIIHDFLAPILLGRSAFDIENHWNNMFSMTNFCGFAGAEARAISAIDIALWDLLGQYTGQPIYNLLGGRNRERVPVYNTCVSSGKYDDWHACTEGRAGELAVDLLKQGYTAMKIWPFDRFGWTLGGPTQTETAALWGGDSERKSAAVGVRAHDLSESDLQQGIQVVADIRRATGGKMNVAIEGHARWDLPCAVRIARALEPFNVMWLEEVMPPDNVDAFVRLKQQTTVPLCQSERLITRYAFRQFIEKNAADIIMPDIVWCGGITEANKIATLADTYYLPITSHDTVGPVALLAAAHLMLHIPNGRIMEMVRGYTEGWYQDVLDEPFIIREGQLLLKGKPGLGARLRPEFLNSSNAIIECSREKEAKSPATVS